VAVELVRKCREGERERPSSLVEACWSSVLDTLEPRVRDPSVTRSGLLAVPRAIGGDRNRPSLCLTTSRPGTRRTVGERGAQS